ETFELANCFHQRMNDALAESGAHIDRFYICPHLPKDRCRCHKPRPGLFLQALNECGVPAEQTLAIGDRRADVVAARRAGMAHRLLQKSWAAGLGPFRHLVCRRLIAHPTDALAILAPTDIAGTA